MLIFFREQTNLIGKFSGVFERMTCFVWMIGEPGPLGPPWLHHWNTISSWCKKMSDNLKQIKK